MENNKNLELFNMILEENNDDLDDNKCLIDGLTLKKNFITLDCGHKFNYISLYNEIVYQKTKRILDNSYLRFNSLASRFPISGDTPSGNPDASFPLISKKLLKFKPIRRTPVGANFFEIASVIKNFFFVYYILI